ncbi:MAG: Rv3235 family protein [Actinomycetota bacterium]|nr:Rv3235 family protein [Actinomycetota bacterium]
MTASIAEPRPQLPVLRRLVDILPTPTPTPTTVTLSLAPPLPAADPTASVLAQRVLRAAVEVVGGRRPAGQLSAVLGPDLLAYLVSLQATAGHLEPRVGKVLAQQHPGGVLEAVALVTLSTGVRALAARFEKQGSRWRCTALQLRLTTGDLATRRGRRIHRP